MELKQRPVNTSAYKNVWLCDDDPDDHYVFAEALSNVLPQASLSIFGNGSELLLELHRQRPDILFLDINMPVVNGLEALQKIGEIPDLKNLPIVMHSVSEQTTDISACYQLGAVLYLVKPQLYQDLVSQLTAIFTLDWSDTNLVSSMQTNRGSFIPASNTE